MPGSNNLSMKVGNGDYKKIGDPDYIYGWTWTQSEDGSRGGGDSRTAYLIGDDFYILAFNMNKDDGIKETTGVHKINIKTNKVTRISSKEVMMFQLDNDYIYYPSGNAIYRYSIKTSKEELVKQVFTDDNNISYISVLNGNMFIKDTKNDSLCDIEGKNINPGAKLNGMQIMGNYLVCTFEEDNSSRYRIMVFNKEGKIVFKSSDTAYLGSIGIYGDTMYFYNITTGNVCMYKLG